MQPIKLLVRLLIGLSILVGTVAYAAAPAGYPSSYGGLSAAAAREGKLVIYSTTDTSVVAPLIREFQSTYPGVQVEYLDLVSTELYNRYLSETAVGSPADVLWSSAMDLQVKLVNDGHALRYNSPEIPALPGWAHWREEAYGTTFEPIAFVYNKKLMSEKEVPRTHAALYNLIRNNPAKYRGKVTTYDAERSGLGFLLATQDSKLNPGFWALVRELGAANAKLQSNTGAMIAQIATGESLIGYNLLGSYALTSAQGDPAIGVVLSTDYTLAISRLMFISRRARHPNAAKLWLDFVLSRRGQILLSQAGLYSVRNDVDGVASGTRLVKDLGKAMRPVTVGPGLLVYLDQTKRADFLRQWHQVFSPPASKP